MAVAMHLESAAAETDEVQALADSDAICAAFLVDDEVCTVVVGCSYHVEVLADQWSLALAEAEAASVSKALRSESDSHSHW